MTETAMHRRSYRDTMNTDAYCAERTVLPIRLTVTKFSEAKTDRKAKGTGFGCIFADGGVTGARTACIETVRLILP